MDLMSAVTMEPEVTIVNSGSAACTPKTAICGETPALPPHVATTKCLPSSEAAMALGRFCTVEPASEGYGYVHSGVIGAFTSCNITVTCVYVSAVQPIASVCEASPAGSDDL